MHRIFKCCSRNTVQKPLTNLHSATFSATLSGEMASQSGPNFGPIPFQDLKASVSRSIDVFALGCRGKGLITIDFDATIIQVHTYGSWSGCAAALAAHVRPVFVAILQTAVPMENITVAIVTFSGQIGLIRDVLVREHVSVLLNKCI